MLNGILRTVAALIAAYTLFVWLLGFVFRMDTFGELRWALWVDIRIGFVLAFAFLLWRAPTPLGANWRRHVITAIGVILIWALVTGSLWQTHLEQTSIRGHVPMDELIDQYLWSAIVEKPT